MPGLAAGGGTSAVARLAAVGHLAAGRLAVVGGAGDVAVQGGAAGGPGDRAAGKVGRVLNVVLLGLIAGAAVLNSFFLDHPIPYWRQALFPAVAAAAYLHGRHLPARRSWPVLAVAALPGLVAAFVSIPHAVGALAALVVVTLPWLTGRFRRQQAVLMEAGVERVARLEREQRLTAEQARLRERARITAGLHDALGHDLALIALRAGALELATDLAPQHRDAAAALRSAAVTATDRLRDTLGMLRTDESVDTLVHRAREAGMTVHLRSDATVETPTVHRVVREALTNAARHAPGAPVTVHIAQPAHRTVTVTVGNPVPRRRDPPGTGTGLTALRDHIGLLGGTLHAAETNGTFTVSARIPLPGRAPALAHPSGPAGPPGGGTR